MTKLRLYDSTRVLSGGTILVGGRPVTLFRLTDAGARAVREWTAGAPVGDSAAARRLARRLVDTGLARPSLGPSPWGLGDVAVVVPARDRADLLSSCLAGLGPVAETVVVDDGSSDPFAVAAAATKHGVRVVRLARGAGPAAARNAGIAATTAPVLAFIDSDARPVAGWLESLLTAFADDSVGAVAPRIRASGAGSVVCIYERARSPLDLGPLPGTVGPGRAIRFVPATALVARRDALGGGFEASLRYGEDVDLVWRLASGGWTVSYEPSARVEHPHRAGVVAWLGQRIAYGSAAAPLARRHPGALPHLVVPASALPGWALVLAGRPRSALLALGTAIAVDGHRLPAGVRVRLLPLAAQTHARAALALCDACWRVYPPIVLAAAVRSRRARRLAAGALAASVAADWLVRRPSIDPLRFGAMRVADDLAYATGLWLGCLRSREPGPLVPRFSWSYRRTGRR